MSTVIFNEALGWFVGLAQRVEDNDPAGCLFRIHAWVISATDSSIRDVGGGGHIDDIEALASVAEATNVGYANISMDAADITITVDDVNDSVEVDFSDQVFTSVAAGDIWTDISVSYDPDGTDTDSATKCLQMMDCNVEPKGGDILMSFA